MHRPSSLRVAGEGQRRSPVVLVLPIALVVLLGAAACTVGEDRAQRVSATDGTDAPTTAVSPETVSSAIPDTTSTSVAVADDDRDGIVRVVLWGDSLAFEARESFLLALGTRPGVVAEARTFGGVAICDYLDEIGRRAAEVEVALLEFSGNSMWTCMVDPTTGVAPSGEGVAARYEADLTTAVELLHAGGAIVVLVGAPPAGFEPPTGERNQVRALYERFAASHEAVTYVDAGAVVLEDGSYSDTLACLPFEDQSLGCGPDERIIVRNADQLHFCPSPHQPDPFVGRCDVWPSGAHRYGQLMAQAALVAAGLEDAEAVGNGPLVSGEERR